MIMAVNPIIDRSLLHFPEETRRRFAFLEALGFRCLRSEATLVRYESTAMAICIYQGRQSYEVALEIQSMQGPAESYSFSEILRLVDPKRADGYRNFVAHTAEGVAEGVLRLAGLLHECLDAGILSDGRLFSRLKLQRIDMSRNYALEVQLKGAQNELKSAWAKKDFSKVVQILSPLQEHLNPSDLRKLEYAKKHR